MELHLEEHGDVQTHDMALEEFEEFGDGVVLEEFQQPNCHDNCKARHFSKRLCKSDAKSKQKRSKSELLLSAAQISQFMYATASLAQYFVLCGGIAVELFAGTQPVTEAWRAMAVAAVGLELKDGCDVTQPDVVAMIMNFIRAGFIRCMHCSPPCNSWSRARRGKPRLGKGGFPVPIRSLINLLGLPGLSEANRRCVELGNRTADVAVQIIKCCIECRCPVSLEHPQTSWLWRLPGLLDLLNTAHVVDVHMCQFGANWKKPTRLAVWGCDASVFKQYRCKPLRGGICSASGQKHEQLSGMACAGQFKSQLTPYPPKFARTLAQLLSSAAGPLAQHGA